MSGKGSIGERVEEIAASVTKAAGIELVHCQILGSKLNSTVRVFIDKPGGVTLEDCARVSRGVEEVLDQDDLIPTSYVLEVSSPGIERELFKLKDFEKYTGQDAKIKTFKPIDGQRNFAGRIVAVAGDEIEFNDRTNGLVNIPFELVAKANLMVDIREDLKKA